MILQLIKLEWYLTWSTISLQSEHTHNMLPNNESRLLLAPVSSVRDKALRISPILKLFSNYHLNTSQSIKLFKYSAAAGSRAGVARYLTHSDHRCNRTCSTAQLWSRDTCPLDTRAGLVSISCGFQTEFLASFDGYRNNSFPGSMKPIDIFHNPLYFDLKSFEFWFHEWVQK